MISWITINRNCNLRCKWCYAEGRNFDIKQSISLSLVQKVISISKDLGVKEVCITGGEPTIHPDFIEITRMIKNSGLNPSVVTNGIKFEDSHFLQHAIESGLESISLSLKAPNSKLYKEWTGIDCILQVRKAITNIIKSKIKHSVSFTLTTYSENKISSLVQTIKEMGVIYFTLDLGRPVIENGKCDSNCVIEPEKIGHVIKQAFFLLEKTDIKYAISMSVPFCLIEERLLNQMLAKDVLISGCQIHNRDGFIIDPVGNIIPCNHFCDHILGTIGLDFETGADYLNFVTKKAIKEFYEYTTNYPHEKCVECTWWEKCGGGCFIRWLSSNANKLVR